MTEVEVAEILQLFETAYGSKRFYAETNKLDVLKIWLAVFKDDDVNLVREAAVGCISTLEFAPTVADIKKRMIEIKLSGQMTEMEAFQEIKKAVRDISSGRKHAMDAYNDLPPILRRTCGGVRQLIDWTQVPTESFETVVASHIRQSYRTEAAKEVGFFSLPKQMQENEKWMIEGGEQVCLPISKVQSVAEKAEAELYKQIHENRPKELSTKGKELLEKMFVPIDEKEEQRMKKKLGMAIDDEKNESNQGVAELSEIAKKLKNQILSDSNRNK